MKKIIQTPNAPAAIGCYSQAVQVENTIYVSGQIGLNPQTMTLVSDDFATQAAQVFHNLSAIAQTAGTTLNNCVKLTIYLTDLSDFNQLNTIMMNFLQAPYPARATIQVAALPRQAKIEIDAVITIS